jgi:RHS repeat-associated protein
MDESGSAGYASSTRSATTNGAPAQSSYAASQAPTLTLPKGGGAIRSIGEKFAASPVTGTGSMSVPIASSLGRSGFGPQLSLSYDSGAGNGPFGFGWSLAVPSITRKTDKGLPQYYDAAEAEADVFVLSGAEDLVPEFKKDAGGNWIVEADKHVVFDEPRTVDGVIFTVRRYRPRVEGLFARIERWTSRNNPADVRWRSISRDNITSWYGKTAESRIADPSDPARIFSWLICESHDDKGNVIVYQYKPEDSQLVGMARAHERNRNGKTRAANRYLKRIRYGNHTPYLPRLLATKPWPLPEGAFAQDGSQDWFFEVVFDYGDHDALNPTPNDSATWPVRNDPFSSYRSGFELRSYRLCQRVLMFHHFAGEDGVGNNCLVRSTDLTYSYEQNPADARNPIFSYLRSVTQTGYKRQGTDGYLARSLPPVEFSYTEAIIQAELRELNVDSLTNLPVGIDGAAYQWVDLDGEGLSGILSEQAGAWFYKRNLSPLNVVAQHGGTHIEAHFGPVELVASKPALALANRAQFLDLAGDGRPDLVQFGGVTPGFYERTTDEQWEPFVAFDSLPVVDWNDPNLKFIDLDGDGHADILISEDNVLRWHPSLGEAGFAAEQRVGLPWDEEHGPRVVFADAAQSIYLADLSGDGLSDIARIRNGEVCYWPNLGYGRFGTKVTMDNAPYFDAPDQFDQQRIRLADIDGSGLTDILYLAHDGVQVYFNQSGNRWSAPTVVEQLPVFDNLASVQVLDLLGNGTACLVWSSPLPGDAGRPLCYLELMREKPHLLVKSVNNLGAETRVDYAPSTKFYLQDRLNGTPWITRLPFPVHCVERVETLDHVSGNRFVTRYAYHHGYFDGPEREFRGFGMVEQWDTEEFAALSAGGTLLEATNIDLASHMPPVYTKTWFHTGAYLAQNTISQHLVGEYYAGDMLAVLLPDSVLPGGLSLDEEREACRALKGSMLRQEVYALDGTEKAEHPYSVAEQNVTLRLLQPQARNRHAVFFSHAREALSYHYERNPDDPRISQALTLEVDAFGNVLKSAAVGYGRRAASTDPALTSEERAKQTGTLITYTENRVTNPIAEQDAYRTPLPCETRSYELTGYTPTSASGRFDLADLVQPDPADPTRLLHRFDNEIGYEAEPTAGHQRRLIEQIRTRYRRDDLNGPLPLGDLQALALPFESYKLAFTPGLLAQVYQRPLAVAPLPGAPEPENLLPSLADLLGGQGADSGGYVDLDGDGQWWIPSGQVFYSPEPNNTFTQELAFAREHFFLPHRHRDPFHSDALSTERFVSYDDYDLLVIRTRDALGNLVSAETQDDAGTSAIRIDYRVLQPYWMTDPNGNRAAVAFDALGMVVASAVMGKPGQGLGDQLEGFDADPPLPMLQAFAANPHNQAAALLGSASTRIVYDLDRFWRCGQPPFAAALARETHVSDPGGAQSVIQIGFAYSDGFGREIQQKIQAERGDAPRRAPDVALPSGDIRPGELVREADGKLVQADASPRWVGTGRTVYNNKGKPVRQYEPFFSSSHLYELERELTDSGVSPILFYDPVGRVIATLHPNHSYEKVVFDPWQQTSYDVNDTVAAQGDQSGDPRSDPDIEGYLAEYFKVQLAGWQTWHQQRVAGARGAAEQAAAEQAMLHANTPSTAHLDSLGRTFLTIARNRFQREQSDGTLATVEEQYATRIVLDIEGNQRAVIDALGRTVMHYHYDMLGNRIHQASMEAGERWTLNDVMGRPIHAWDSRRFSRRLAYDALRRPTDAFLRQGAGSELLVGRTIYGEGQGDALNQRAQVFQAFDQAGVVTSEAYDFKGNLLRSQRRLARTYKSTLDWADAPLMEEDVFTSSNTFDALNRPLRVTAPDNSVYRPTFNAANLLERVDVRLRGAAGETTFVKNIDYNAKGQRTLIAYGNGATTSYSYDPDTFRLTDMRTTRPPGLNGLASQLFQTATTLQDLRYTYDPAGNITRIADAALPTIFHDNQQVEPVSSYIYDAIYRLIEAQGREHAGQAAFDFDPAGGNRRDFAFLGARAQPNNLQALRNYSERYAYDAVGNFEQLRHIASGGSWTRGYLYDEPSLLDPNTRSNRLTRTTVGNGSSFSESYSYSNAQGDDVQGCMTAINAMSLVWDYADQLHEADLGGGGRAYYVYDAAGQRVRKVIETQQGARRQERLYLGGFEIYREYNGSAVTLQRETLHVMDDQQRIALVETRTQGEDGSPPQLIRYQLGNHLGSASLELDASGQLISYEEYHPYGTSSFQAGRSAAEGSAKRYRYTGKERDDETGLYYHGARYYAPWLGRWVSADPAGMVDGSNLYQYVSNNPIILIDRNGKWGEYLKKGVELWGEYRRGQGEAVKEIIDETVEGVKQLPDVVRDLTKPMPPLYFPPLITKDSGPVQDRLEEFRDEAVRRAKIVGELAKGVITHPFEAAGKAAKNAAEGAEAVAEGEYKTGAKKFGKASVQGIDAVLSAVPIGAGAARTGARALRSFRTLRGFRKVPPPLSGLREGPKSPPRSNSKGLPSSSAETPPGSIKPRVSPVLDDLVAKQVQMAKEFYPRHKGAVGSLIVEGRKPMFVKSGHEGGPWGGTQRGNIPRGKGEAFSGGGPSESNIATHVEGHAAAIMWEQGIKKATLVVDRIECSVCSRDLSTALPPGSELIVVSPGQPPTTYTSARGR